MSVTNMTFCISIFFSNKVLVECKIDVTLRKLMVTESNEISFLEIIVFGIVNSMKSMSCEISGHIPEMLFLSICIRSIFIKLPDL